MHVFWYAVIALLWAGFFVLEAFGLGVGTLLPLIGRTDERRGLIAATIAPAWDGNEGWLLAAGAATFLAFRGWFDGLLTGFTALFAAIFGGLIARAVALNSRPKAATPRGRLICDAVVFVGSIGPAFVLGLLFANFLHGVLLDAGGSVRNEFSMNFAPFALLGAAVCVLLFAFQGAAFLSMRTFGVTHMLAHRAMVVIAPLSAATLIGFITWTELERGGVLSRVLAGALTIGVLALLIRAGLGHPFRAFTDAAVTILLLPLWVFSALWPDVLPARNYKPLSLTVYNTAASHGALIALTIIGVELAAVVLVYLTWSYWIFHARVTGKNVMIDSDDDRMPSFRGPTNGPDKLHVTALAAVSRTLHQPVSELGRAPTTSEA